MGSSVKIMLSYNYCHFEISKHTDQNLTDKEINEMRKDVQRLADEAVRQYIVAKDKATKRASLISEKMNLEKEVKEINSKPEEEWNSTDKAKVKALADREYWDRYNYYYDDDNEEDW